MRITLLKRLLVGPPMPLAQARHERLGKAVALAVFASDPLSSVAYATEEILLVLILAGSAALSYSLPVALGIAALLAVAVADLLLHRRFPGDGRLRARRHHLRSPSRGALRAPSAGP